MQINNLITGSLLQQRSKEEEPGSQTHQLFSLSPPRARICTMQTHAVAGGRGVFVIVVELAEPNITYTVACFHTHSL